MKYLLHCVFEHGSVPPSLPRGAFIHGRGGLDAAFSHIEADEESPTIERLLSYQKLISGLHAQRAVIPLRYGCVRSTEGEIGKLLEDNQEACLELLRRLHGKEEMGLRIISPGGDLPAADVPERADELLPGVAYLNALRRQYRDESRLSSEEEELQSRISTALRDFYVQKRVEVSVVSGRRLLSMCFLVESSAVEPFRNTVRSCAVIRNGPWMVSGPWPPYSFVAGIFGDGVARSSGVVGHVDGSALSGRPS